jgi:response regulator of citrate/malate metabolism
LLKEEIKRRIINELRETYPCDLTIKEVAQRVKISDITAAKYLDVMAASGEVEVSRKIGKIPFFRLKRKMRQSE